MNENTKFEKDILLREKAEEQLRKRSAKARAQLSEAEVLKLIHDLEVHQIELEILNNELVLAKEQADVAAEKYIGLYDFAPSGYLTLSVEGEILEINLNGAKMLGRERSHLMNSGFEFFISEGTKTAFNLFLEQVYGGKAKASCDIALACNGNLPVDVRLTGIAGETGKLCFVTLVDISELKQSEQILKESNDQYRLLSEHMTDVIFMLDMNFRVIFQSPSSEKLRGFTTEELRNMPLEKSMAPESLRLALEMFNKEMSRILIDPLYNSIPAIELEYYNKDGTTSWLENKFSLIRNSDGLPISILGEGRDISERRKMQQTLKENETRAQAFLTAIPDLIFMINREGVYLFYKAAKEDLAFQTESIIGKRNRDITSPEFADLIDQKINLAFEQNEMQVFEYDLHVPDSGLRKYEARMVPSGPDELIAIVRDVTEQTNAVAEIRYKNELLSKLNAEKDKFFSIIAHDLRSPFNAFLGFTQMLVEDMEELSFKEVRNIAISMSNSAANLFSLLENLLEWSRFNRGLISMNPESFLILPKIIESQQTVLESASKKGILMNYAIPVDLSVVADINMFGSIIRNLIYNAVKFTPTGGKIIIAAKTLADNRVEVSISDTGIGMSKEILDKLFQLDGKINRKGTEGEPSTGLGLILCKDFIEMHGGEISVESEEGKGSIFKFTVGHGD
jgi:PAS domain S-box-containing protein